MLCNGYNININYIIVDVRRILKIPVTRTPKKQILKIHSRQKQIRPPMETWPKPARTKKPQKQRLPIIMVVENKTKEAEIINSECDKIIQE